MLKKTFFMNVLLETQTSKNEIFQNTRCFDYILSKVNGCSTETVHFRTYVGKAKMHLRGGSFFQFSKICLHFSAVCLQFFQKN